MAYKRQIRIIAKEQLFCQAVAKGENGSSAYKRMWQAHSAQPNSIHTASHRLLKRAEIRLKFQLFRSR